MFGLKKIVPALAAVIALSIPSLALADDHVGRDVGRDHAVVQLRDEIAREKIDVARDMREHRWEAARQAQRQMDRHEQALRDLLRR